MPEGWSPDRDRFPAVPVRSDELRSWMPYTLARPVPLDSGLVLRSPDEEQNPASRLARQRAAVARQMLRGNDNRDALTVAALRREAGQLTPDQTAPDGGVIERSEPDAEGNEPDLYDGPPVCKWCHMEIERAVHGPPPDYCSNAHRQAAHRQRQRAAKNSVASAKG
jgi:hypothetical protein